MTRFILVCLGSAAGGGARYLVSSWVQRASGTGLPLGTLAVNLIGSFLVAAIMQFATTGSMSETARVTLTVGVLGGFTTYSSFSFETLSLMRQGAWPSAAAIMGLTLFGCLAACAGGWIAAHWIASSSS
jgi:CrcB protein